MDKLRYPRIRPSHLRAVNGTSISPLKITLEVKSAVRYCRRFHTPTIPVEANALAGRNVDDVLVTYRNNPIYIHHRYSRSTFALA